jgi:hypothetical protein
MDSLMFDASYMGCDAGAVHALLADEAVFHHDRSGLHRGAQMRADFARLIAPCPCRQGGFGPRAPRCPGTWCTPGLRRDMFSAPECWAFPTRGEWRRTDARLVGVAKQPGLNGSLHHRPGREHTSPCS